MIKYLVMLLLLLGILITSQYSLASPINVPTDHWSYEYIERFQAKGVLADYLSNIKPYSRKDVAAMLLQISKFSEEGKIKLSKIENQQLEMLKSESTFFRESLRGQQIGIAVSGVVFYAHIPFRNEVFQI